MFRFRKQERLASREDILDVKSHGRHASCRGLKVIALPGKVGNSRISIIPARSYGNAVARNRARRLVREAWRLHKNSIRAAYDVVVISYPEPSADTMGARLVQLSKLTRNLGMVRDRND